MISLIPNIQNTLRPDASESIRLWQCESLYIYYSGFLSLTQCQEKLIQQTSQLKHANRFSMSILCPYQTLFRLLYGYEGTVHGPGSHLSRSKIIDRGSAKSQLDCWKQTEGVLPFTQEASSALTASLKGDFFRNAEDRDWLTRLIGQLVPTSNPTYNSKKKKKLPFTGQSSTNKWFQRDVAVSVSNDSSLVFCSLIQRRRRDEEALVKHQITVSANLQIQTTIWKV